MLTHLKEVDAVDAAKALESVYEHTKHAKEMEELLDRYDTTEELLESEGEKVTEIRKAAENSYLTQVYTEAEKELQSAYDAAEWT